MTYDSNKKQLKDIDDKMIETGYNKLMQHVPKKYGN